MRRRTELEDAKMDVFQIALLSATLLCSLVAGFVFAFARVTMPGIGTLGDRDDAVAAARGDFEPRWNRWNQIRAVLSTLTSVLLIVLVWRL